MPIATDPIERAVCAMKRAEAESFSCARATLCVVIARNARDNDCARARYLEALATSESRLTAVISAAPGELLITAGIALIIPPAARTLNKSSSRREKLQERSLPVTESGFCLFFRLIDPAHLVSPIRGSTLRAHARSGIR